MGGAASKTASVCLFLLARPLVAYRHEARKFDVLAVQKLR